MKGFHKNSHRIKNVVHYVHVKSWISNCIQSLKKPYCFYLYFWIEIFMESPWLGSNLIPWYLHEIYLSYSCEIPWEGLVDPQFMFHLSFPICLFREIYRLIPNFSFSITKLSIVIKIVIQLLLSSISSIINLYNIFKDIKGKYSSAINEGLI